MRQILNVKPEHESVVVERIETYLVKSLRASFPDKNFDAFSKKFAFTTDEKTLITDSSEGGAEGGQEKPKLPPGLGIKAASRPFSDDLEKTTAAKLGGEPVDTPDQRKRQLVYLLAGLIFISLCILAYLLLF